MPEGAEHVVCDRAAGPVPAGPRVRRRTTRSSTWPDQPGRVRHAVDAFPDAHWVFVSTINVYADDATPNGTPDTLPLREPVARHDEDRRAHPRLYGAMKVSCERRCSRAPRPRW